MTIQGSDETGHFERGRWVKDEEPDAAGQNSDEKVADFSARIKAAQSEVSRVFGDVLSLGKDIMTTEEGKQHIEDQVKKTSDDIISTLNHLGNEAAKTVEKTVKQAFKKIRR
jgi:hypothetical protein